MVPDRVRACHAQLSNVLPTTFSQPYNTARRLFSHSHTQVAAITGFKNSVIGVSASPSNGTFATGSGDNLVCVWNYGDRADRDHPAAGPSSSSAAARSSSPASARSSSAEKPASSSSRPNSSAPREEGGGGAPYSSPGRASPSKGLKGSKGVGSGSGSGREDGDGSSNIRGGGGAVQKGGGGAGGGSGMTNGRGRVSPSERDGKR